MGDLTNNFSLSEFRCHDGTAVPPSLIANVKRLAHNLQILRDLVGKPIMINSGYRTPSWNARKGGKPKSLHLTASAADIRIPGMTPREVYKLIDELIVAGRLTPGGLHKYPNGFVHYDIRGVRAYW